MIKEFKIFKNLISVLLTVLILGLAAGTASAANATVELGNASNFAILAGTAITGAASNVITGDVGLSPGLGVSITGLDCGEVTGTIYSVDADPALLCHENNSGLLTTAKNNLSAAINDSAGRTPVTTLVDDLNGQTLTPGVYGGTALTLTTTLTLDAQGNASDIFIIKAATTLHTLANSHVNLINSAQASNVFWQVGTTATLETGTLFNGTIMANDTITLVTAPNVKGRLLARDGAVTLGAGSVVTTPSSIAIASNITSWENNKTNNNNLNITVNASEPVKFNATANQTITTWNWFKDGVNQNNNYNNFTAIFTAGDHTVKVNATNANGTSNTITWNVTVPATGGSSRSAVDLGTAGNFVILSKSGISTTGTTSIVGDIGVSPAAATYITGFGLIMDSSNEFSTSSLVNGKVYAADYSPPTPSTMTTAVLDMQTAYTDAAGRTIPDATELGAGEIGGLTLAPGLYKWSSGLKISTDVTLAGNSTDVWIFQIAQTLDLSNGKQVILSGGALASNIFWQVGGQTTLGTTSVFNGNILDQTAIVLNTGATLNGRALAQTAVTLDANAVIEHTDNTSPTVRSTIPLNLTTGVANNSAISATFSEAMDPSTITNTTFNVTQGGTPVPGTVTYSGVTAIFIPTSNFTISTIYNATITTGAKDLAGNALASDYVWGWTTGAVPDTIAPNVSSTIPVNLTTDVAINSAIYATFSEAMNPSTVTNATFTLKQGATVVSGTVAYSNKTAVFIPASSLAYSTVYTATITTGAKDLAGNALVTEVWTFTTVASPTPPPTDTSSPMVSSIIPANLATGVAINSAISAVFSESLNPLTVNSATFTLKQGTTPVSGTVTYSGVTAVFKPASNLLYNTTYTARISGVQDLAGNGMTAYVWTFTTGAAPDTTPPMVTTTVHANGSTGVPINTRIAATFSEVMDPLTINTTTFTFKQGTTPVSGTVTYSGVTAVFTPPGNLSFNTTYTATITTGAKDLAGNALASDYVWSWTTGAAPDTTPPTVISTIPVNLAANVATNSAMAAVFSEALDPLTVTTVTFTLKQGAMPVSGTVTYSGVTAVFTPASSLASTTTYTATITTGIKDLAGNALAVNKVWTFTTGTATEQVPVDLGSANSFAILAKSGISTTGTTSIVGDIGVSPIESTAITGFGLTMDASGEFATSSLVTGKVYAADYAPPTPAKMTTAVLNMQTAYTDAAGRTLPDYTELGGGNIGGLTLAPGLYKWSTGVTIPTDVTLSGGENDVWIFQIAQTLDISSGKQVILSGGAQARNIFWQVAGQTTLGTTSVFNGNILDQAGIVLNTGAILNGRALAQTAVTLDSNAITVPSFTTVQPMLVSSITPNSRNAQVGTPVTIFMSVINYGTATATDVSITQSSGLPVTVSYIQWNGITFTGVANTPADIAAGATANYVLTINATSAFTTSSLTFNVSGTNVEAAPISAVNTLTIAASATPVADVIMISTNLNVSASLNNWKDIAVATTNVGASATGVSFNVVVPSSITGLITQVNQTNPTTGAIIGPATGLTINAGAQPTFAVFLYPTQAIAFDPTDNRITLQLVDGTGNVIGAQSVAISTQ